MSNSLPQIFLAVFLLIILMFLQGFGVLSPVMDWGRIGSGFLATPLVKILEVTKNFVGTLSGIRNLAIENSFLENQVQKLTADLALLERASEENQVLREALGFQGRTNLNLISAQVMSFDSLNQKAVLNRGGKHGLAVGDSVVVSDTVLVGILTEVNDLTSQMELITSSGAVINARTSNGSASGIIRGEHGVGLLFDQIARSESIQTGDRVVTSGLGGKYVSNLFIGEVRDVRESTSELFQAASVTPAADLHNLEVVFIVKK